VILLTNIIIIYDSWFGNTQVVAETIAKGINEIEKKTVHIKKIEDTAPNDVLDYDIILIGSPNHMGGPTRKVKKFIDNLGKLKIDDKQIAVFDTYVRKNVHIGKTVRKMEKRISENLSDLKIMTDGLSIQVKGVRGPLEKGELSKCILFGNKLIK